MRLTMAQRRAIPKSQYGVPQMAPGPGSYPLPDKAHARAAIMLSGNASPAEQILIKAKARRLLEKKNVV